MNLKIILSHPNRDWVDQFEKSSKGHPQFSACVTQPNVAAIPGVDATYVSIGLAHELGIMSGLLWQEHPEYHPAHIVEIGSPARGVGWPRYAVVGTVLKEGSPKDLGSQLHSVIHAIVKEVARYNVEKAKMIQSVHVGLEWTIWEKMLPAETAETIITAYLDARDDL
jgi:hypothetical protein